MSYDPNLPAGLPSDFNDEATMKTCPNCIKGEIVDYGEGTECPSCEGTGEVEMDFKSIKDALEEMRENENRHEL